MRSVKIFVPVVPVVAVLLLTGCASESNGSTLTEGQIQRLADEAEEAGYTEQADMLQDGQVSAKEYEAAVDNFARCASEYGYSVSERVVSPVDSLRLEYVTDAGGFDQDAASANIQACSESQVAIVERGYLGSHEARMDVPLLRAMDKCVKDRGVRTTGDEVAAQDFFELDGMDPGLFSECISKSADDLYPELPSLSVSF